MKLANYLKEQLKNPDFRREYERYKFFISPIKTKFTLDSSESSNCEALSCEVAEVNISELKDI